MTTAVVDRIDAATMDISRDVMLRLAIMSSSASESLYYAKRVIATYQHEAAAQIGYAHAETDKRLNAARALEGRISSYFLEQGTKSAMVQYALALAHQQPTDLKDTVYEDNVYEENEIVRNQLGRIRNAADAQDRIGDVSINDLVNLQQPPERERDIGHLATLALEVKENTKALESGYEKWQRSGWASQDEREGYTKLLYKTNALRRAILPKLAHMSLEEPTAAAKVSASIGMKLEEFVQAYS